MPPGPSTRKNLLQGCVLESFLRGIHLMWSGQTISVIFPAYNEAPNIRSAIRDFQSVGIVDEILVVDNNSTDGTGTMAAEEKARVVCETRQGYGWALRRGLREATGEWIALCEPDGTFLARDLIKLLAYSEDFRFILGTRTAREMIWAEANMGWFLRWGNKSVAKLLQVLFKGPSLSDCGCTFRLIHRSVRDRLQDRLTVGGSHFLVDLTIQALKIGTPAIEIPLNYRRRIGQSKITGSLSGSMRTGLRMLWLILRERLR
jgi:glycosyltransferase involved in cell wall biosynthesis